MMSTDAVSEPTIHAGRLVARRLKASGIDTIFTLSGGHLFSIYDGCRDEGIRLIDTRHEQTATFAAEGWSKVTRSPGVAALTAGPGVTNGMSAMAAAQQNQSPLVVLGGRAPALRWGMGSLQEIDHVPFVAPLARFAATAQSGEDAGRLVDEALRAAVGAPSGVGFVDFPMDHVFSPAEDDGLPGALTDLPAAAAAGHRGTGPRRSHAGRRATAGDHGGHQRVVGARGGGAASSGRGTADPGADERDGPWRRACRSPVGIFAGARQSVEQRRRGAGCRRARWISGWASAGFSDRKPSSSWPTASSPEREHPRPIAAGTLRRPDVDPDGAGRTGAGDHQDWIAELRTAETAARDLEKAELGDDRSPLHPMRVYAELAPLLDRDAIVVIDAGDFGSYAGRVIDSYLPGCWLDSGPFGCLGSGPGYALAAKLARPGPSGRPAAGRRRISGSAAWNGTPWSDTACRSYRSSATTESGAWKSTRWRRCYGYSVVAELRPGTRYDEVVRALGGHGELVAAPAELRPALERAFASGLPAVVNVLTDPTIAYPRRSNLG